MPTRMICRQRPGKDTTTAGAAHETYGIAARSSPTASPGPASLLSPVRAPNPPGARTCRTGHGAPDGSAWTR